MESKLRSAVESLIDSIDKSHFRSMRKQGFMCAAKCCDDSATHEDLQRCADACQSRVQAAEEALGRELEGFQNRLQRCAVSCQDSIAVNLPANPTQEQIKQVESKVDTCVERCVDEAITSLGPMKTRVESIIATMKKA